MALNVSSKIYNDYNALDKHIKELSVCRENLAKNTVRMLDAINNLNEKGFQDGNFANLYKVFTTNTDALKKIEKKLEEFESKCSGFSKLIKEFYNV